MARTVAEIHNEMLAEKAKYESLDSLDNNTSVSIWISIMYVVAIVIASLEQLQDVFKSELQELSETLPIGTTNWYAQKALDYQEGYSLTYNRENGGFEYDIIDDVSKINKVSSCVVESGNIIIKVAKDNGIGGLINLTLQEVNSVQSYFDTVKIVGPVLKVQSQEPDIMRLSLKIKVDESKINNLGQSVTDDTVYPVEEAINLYISSFSLTTFNSELLMISLIDEIQKVDGVINIKVNSAEAKAASSILFTDILDSDFNTYSSFAGYLVIDDAYTLRDNIEYL